MKDPSAFASAPPLGASMFPPGSTTRPSVPGLNQPPLEPGSDLFREPPPEAQAAPLPHTAERRRVGVPT